ncbi:MAG: hypothetical protein IT319_11975, partial [Anaerolineae bacterium]|nr:hypothetical protein [Anaerolineae bacterium]
LNRNDSIYADGGDQMVLQLVKGDDGSYSTTYSVGLDLSDEAVGASDSASGFGGNPDRVGGGTGRGPGGAAPGGGSPLGVTPNATATPETT